MAFAHDLQALAEKAVEQKETLKTEEATKNALIMPFLQVLGYDVFNPHEVIPEYTADGGRRTDRKVDYALCPVPADPPKPAIIIECKKRTDDLKAGHTDQLHRYFPQTPACFGILTNGLLYQFYTDVKERNKMESDPFLEVDLGALTPATIQELEGFTKARFDLDKATQRAEELQYTHAVKQKFTTYYETPDDTPPDDAWVGYFVGQVSDKRNTSAFRRQFAPIVSQAFRQFVNDQINARMLDRLAQHTHGTGAQSAPADRPAPATGLHDDHATDTKIITTEEELNAWYIIKAILRGRVTPERVALRDVQSYCNVLLDDNQNKRICRLRFNNPQKKQLGLFDADKTERKVPIRSLDDLYQFADQLIAAVDRYEQKM